jgi:HNH endonuclease
VSPVEAAANSSCIPGPLTRLPLRPWPSPITCRHSKLYLRNSSSHHVSLAHRQNMPYLRRARHPQGRHLLQPLLLRPGASGGPGHAHLPQLRAYLHRSQLQCRARPYGRLFGKVPGPPALHRVIWAEHHGPIPPNFVVRHLDGDPDNNDISNLELVHSRDVALLTHSKTQPTCLHCDRPARTRGLCPRHYQ